MGKRKHPEGCTRELSATVIENSKATLITRVSGVDTVTVPEGTIGEAMITQAARNITEPVEMTVTKLGPFLSLLMDVGYNVW